MDLKGLSTRDFAILLNTSAESDIFKYEEMYPEHHEAIDSYWRNKQEINVDDILLEDTDFLLTNLRRCTNLKKVTINWCESEGDDVSESERKVIDKLYNTIPQIVACYCRNLEVLDIKGKDLTEEDIEAFSSLTKLKIIRFAGVNYCKHLETLLINNPQIEEFDLECNVEDTLFDRLPNTIKKLHLWATHKDSITRLMPKIETMQLVELSLQDTLMHGEDIRRLAKQTTLRSICLWFHALDSDLGLLFSNNPQLEKVRLINEEDYNHGACLRKLPKTLKVLCLMFFPNIKEEDLVSCFKTCNIEKLILQGLQSEHKYLPELVKVATSLKKLTINCENCSVENLLTIQQLTQLKELSLLGLTPQHKKAVKVIKKTLKLEKLSTTKCAANYTTEQWNLKAAKKVLRENN